MSLSVIIPTFNNVNFLPELFESIEKNDFNGEYEILIGIDNCEDTLKYVYENSFSKKYQFFYFLKNNGPYIIKNTLIELSKFDKILFFDSDDIMGSDLLHEINFSLEMYDVIKPKYIDFEIIDNVKEFKNKKAQFGEGVFGIKKKLFLEMNGFEGWRVAADSDFMGRLYKKNFNILHTIPVLFNRRQHPNSLTIHPETGLSSFMRSKYFNQSKKKSILDYVNKEFVIGEYRLVDIENHVFFNSLNTNNSENELTEYQKKKLKHDSISDLFKSTPKTIDKEIKTINYKKINLQTNKQSFSHLTTALKKAKLDNIKKNFGR